MFMLLSVLALCFLSEITLFAIFDNAEAFGVLATNINHQKAPFACNNPATKLRSFAINTK